MQQANRFGYRMFKKPVQRGRSKVHGAMKKERQACARRRVGEPAVLEGEAYSFSPTHPEPADAGSFPSWYVEPLSDARTKPAGFFNIL